MRRIINLPFLSPPASIENYRQDRVNRKRYVLCMIQKRRRDASVCRGQVLRKFRARAVGIVPTNRVIVILT